MIKKFSWPAVALIATVVVLSGVLFFYRLGAEPFDDYDEATYAEVVHESFADNNFLSLHFLGVDYFRKPPLLFWLMEGSQEVMHDVQTADRIPAALAGFLTIVVIMIIVYAVTGDGYAAAFGGGILLATAAFLEPSREIRFDTLASLFDMLALYAFFRARTNRIWLIWLGTFLGLAIFAKGPLVLYAFAAILAATTTLKEWKIFKSRYAWGGVLAILVILLPWHLYETVRSGLAFWHEYVGVQVIDRVAGALFMVSTNNIGYLQYLAWFAAPWSVLFVLSFFSFPFLRTHVSAEVRAAYIACIAGVLSVIVACLITETKAITYLIPLYPFVALGLAVFGYSFVQILNKRERYLVVAFALLCLVVGLTWSAYNGFHLNPDYDTEINLSWEEKLIGEYLIAAHAPIFYVYNVTTLGSIMYYSGIVQPSWLWTGETLAPGSYVLYNTTDTAQISGAYPTVQFVSVVPCSVLTLAEVRAR